MKTWKQWTFTLLIAFFVALLFACASTSKSSTPTRQTTTPTPAKTPQEREADFQQAIASNPNSAKAYYDLGIFYSFDNNQNRRHALAIEPWEKALELDPNYRVNVDFQWIPSAASNIGIKTSSNLVFTDFSLNFLLAQALRESALSTSTNPDIAVAESDKQSSLEKSLVLFRRGYDIDVINRRSSNSNIKQVYLGAIGYTLDKMGRTEEANSTYLELSRITTVTDPIASRIGIAPTNVANTTPSQNRQETTTNNDGTLYGITFLTHSDFSSRINTNRPYATLMSNDLNKIYLLGFNTTSDLELINIMYSSITNVRVYKDMEMPGAANAARNTVITALRRATFAYEAEPVIYSKNNKTVIYVITKTVNAVSLIDNITELSACAFSEKKNLGETLMETLMQLIGLRALAYDPEIFKTFTNQTIALMGSNIIYRSDTLELYENFIKNLQENN